jgi:hypothetical protein
VNSLFKNQFFVNIFYNINSVKDCSACTSVPFFVGSRIPAGFPRAPRGYRLDPDPEVIFVIFIIARCATLDQPFSNSCGIDESKRIILKVFLVDVSLVDPFNHVSMACGMVFCLLSGVIASW